MAARRKPAPLVYDLNPKRPARAPEVVAEDKDVDGSKVIAAVLADGRTGRSNGARDREASLSEERWFIVAGVLVGANGQEGQVASVVGATSEQHARLTFIEEQMTKYGPQGLGVRSVVSAEIDDLAITRKPKPDDAA